jgi:hypothetical protein
MIFCCLNLSKIEYIGTIVHQAHETNSPGQGLH